MTCPSFTDAELLQIYDSDNDILHFPDTKWCTMFSWQWFALERLDRGGRNVSGVGWPCYPSQIYRCP